MRIDLRMDTSFERMTKTGRPCASSIFLSLCTDTALLDNLNSS